MINQETLDNFSLDPTIYDSLLTVAGTIVKINDNRATIKMDDGVEIDCIIHPKVIKSYADQDFCLFEGDDVDILGTFIPGPHSAEILILRCVVYEEQEKRLVS